MTISTQEQIRRELARLRMSQEHMSEDAFAVETETTHQRINDLLDTLESEHSHYVPQ